MTSGPKRKVWWWFMHHIGQAEEPPCHWVDALFNKGSGEEGNKLGRYLVKPAAVVFCCVLNLKYYYNSSILQQPATSKLDFLLILIKLIFGEPAMALDIDCQCNKLL